ncbi:MAG: hypothetical protein AAGE01_17930, partial [Pseudomonadota bacterium]
MSTSVHAKPQGESKKMKTMGRIAGSVGCCSVLLAALGCGSQPSYELPASEQEQAAFLVVHPNPLAGIFPRDRGHVLIYPEACRVNDDDNGQRLANGPSEKNGPLTVRVPAGRQVLINHRYFRLGEPRSLYCHNAYRVTFEAGRTYELRTSYQIKTRAASVTTDSITIAVCEGELTVD